MKFKERIKKIKKLFKGIRKINKIPRKDRSIFLEAFFTMALTRFLILFIPFRKVASFMGKPMCLTSEDLGEELLLAAKRITGIIERLSNHTPWESKCFVKALSAQIMLKKRRIPCTLYLGMSKDKANNISAHAWLRCGKFILLGDKERHGFVTVAYFSVY